MKNEKAQDQLTHLGFYILLSPLFLPQVVTFIFAITTDLEEHLLIGIDVFMAFMILPSAVFMSVLGFIVCHSPFLLSKCFTPEYLSRNEPRPYFLLCVKFPLIVGVYGAVFILYYFLLEV